MIEFKAECGHTVRAKDDDAGAVVRCSYCGRNTNVPETSGDEMDFLFSDAEPIDSKAVRRRKSWNPFRKKTSKGRSLEPFSLIFRMCYVALLASIIIFVGGKYVLPIFKQDGVAQRVSERSRRRPSASPEARPTRRGSDDRGGLIGAKTNGVYVGSTPPGADVYFLPVSKAPKEGRIYNIEGAVRTRANAACTRLGDGEYVVEVVFPWGHAALTDPTLPLADEYTAFRRKVLNASDSERRELLEAYFIPDEAWPVFIDEGEEQFFIVRQYRNLVVRNGRSDGIRSLFLPNIRPGGRNTISIGPLVEYYLPEKNAYVFEDTSVITELDLWGVPEADRGFVVEALRRIGVIPYVTSGGQTRVFKIDVHDGSFLTKIIREAKP